MSSFKPNKKMSSFKTNKNLSSLGLSSFDRKVKRTFPESFSLLCLASKGREGDFLQRDKEENNLQSLPKLPAAATSGKAAGSLEKGNELKKDSFNKKETLPFNFTGLLPFSFLKEKGAFTFFPEKVIKINPNFSVPEGNISENVPAKGLIDEFNVNKAQFESIPQNKNVMNGYSTLDSTKSTDSYFGFSDTKTPKNLTKNKGLSKGQEVVSITYEEIGLFPRSFSRVLDRFLKQIFSDVENLVIQEYRFYRYLFLTTLKCLLILFFVPFFVNILAKTYIVRPLTEYFWNTKQTEIFLNSYQQKRAFSELKEFEEKTYFESLIFPKSVFKPNLHNSSWVENESLVTSGSVSKTTLPTGSTATTTTTLPTATNVPTITPSGPWCDVADINDGTKVAKSLSNTKGSVIGAEFAVVFNLSSPLPDEENKKAVACLPSVGQSNIEHSLNNVSTYGDGKVEKTAIVFSEEKEKIDEYKQTESLINSYTMKSSLFVYQTQEADKNIQQRYQEKTIELAQRYNDQSIEAITNFFADLISLFTLFYLLYVLEIQINITKSFLLEVFFGLDDSKKSLLILLITDLLVGYHSSNLWELFFEFLFHHYGLPESQTGIFLLVATLPVLLDVLFKYLIFRHLNRSSPATVATYHAMIE